MPTIFPGLPAEIPDNGEGSLFITITNVRFAPSSLALRVDDDGSHIPRDVEVIDVASNESFDNEGYMMDHAVEWDSIYKTVTFAFSRIHGFDLLSRVTMVVDGIQYMF